jgi:hypothetical protein
MTGRDSEFKSQKSRSARAKAVIIASRRNASHSSAAVRDVVCVSIGSIGSVRGGERRRRKKRRRGVDRRVVMETVARVVAGGITRSLSDANGGGAARGGADVGNQVRIRTTTRRSRCSDANARGILSINFFSFSLAVRRRRSFVRSSTDDDDVGAFGGRRGSEAPRGGAALRC